jgi:hypothetical protein
MVHKLPGELAKVAIWQEVLAKAREKKYGREMHLVIIESPFAGDIDANIAYARRCVHHSVHANEAPIASHLLFTQPGILDDNSPEERKRGIEAGLAWLPRASYQVFYTDRGWSKGMIQALERGRKFNMSIRVRYFDEPQHLDITQVFAHCEDPNKTWEYYKAALRARPMEKCYDKRPQTVP